MELVELSKTWVQSDVIDSQRRAAALNFDTPVVNKWAIDGVLECRVDKSCASQILPEYFLEPH
jgi:hypothetical protein